MNLHQTLLALHVVVAVLGVGPIVALALAPEEPGLTKLLVRVSRYVQWSLLGMLVTGLLLLRDTGWIYARSAWLQVALGLFLVVGAVLGMANRPLRKAVSEPPPARLARARRLAAASCVGVAIIVWLMAAKPQ